MDIQTIKIIIIAHFVILDAVTAIHALMNKNHTVKRVSKYKENPLIALLKLGFLIPIFTWVFTDLLDFATVQLGNSIQMIGVIAITISVILFSISHIQLGKNWWYTPRIDIDHQFITSGLYKYIRHPMYSTAFLGFGAYFLVAENWIVGIVPMVCFVILYNTRVAKEEELMKEEFGETYLDYAQKTPRLFPKFKF